MQDTKSWLEWRAKGIGASDVPALFGLSKYTNYEKFLLEKIHWKNHMKRKETYITNMGHKWEKIIRNQIFLETMIDYRPVLYVSEEHPYMRVSLDGANPEGGDFIEIKMTGREKFGMLKNKTVPQDFLYQVQYQLAVTGYEYCTLHAVLYKQNKKEMGERVHMIIKPNKNIMEKILIKVTDVWKMIEKERGKYGN